MLTAEFHNAMRDAVLSRLVHFRAVAPEQFMHYYQTHTPNSFIGLLRSVPDSELLMVRLLRVDDCRNWGHVIRSHIKTRSNLQP